MKEYSSRQELIDSIEEKLAQYLAEFEDIPEDLKQVRAEGVDKTPSENLSYQLGWVNLLLDWEWQEQAGQQAETPAPGYKWNNLGGLYQSFYETYGALSLAEQVEQLRAAAGQVCTWLTALTDQEFFEPEQRNWATTKARWPIWKWVHINTVAPFTNFRTQIRKLKRLTL